MFAHLDRHRGLCMYASRIQTIMYLESSLNVFAVGSIIYSIGNEAVSSCDPTSNGQRLFTRTAQNYLAGHLHSRPKCSCLVRSLRVFMHPQLCGLQTRWWPICRCRVICCLFRIFPSRYVCAFPSPGYLSMMIDITQNTCLRIAYPQYRMALDAC
jgi:hypothetical protein